LEVKTSGYVGDYLKKFKGDWRLSKKGAKKGLECLSILKSGSTSIIGYNEEQMKRLHNFKYALQEYLKDYSK